MPPSKEYLALLDIKAILRRWQDLQISDRQALNEIDAVSIARQKREWEEGHK